MDKLKSQERAQKMAAMYKQGITLERIGEQFKLTRERVRQILRAGGVTRTDGGGAKQTQAKEKAASIARDARCMTTYGLTHAELQPLRANGALKAFRQQKQNSHCRGINWKLTLAQWWSIWHQSGFYELRGIGRGKYVMSRICDSGCYELGNVHIQLATENNREAVEKWRGKTKENIGVFRLLPGTGLPFFAKVSGKFIGRFATEEEAVSARNRVMLEKGLKPRGLGRGRGWSYVARNKSRPYLMQITGCKSQSFATAEEAEAAYKAECERLADLKQPKRQTAKAA